MAFSALSPVADAVFGLLQDAALLAVLTGGWHNDLPQAPTYPCGWIEVRERDVRGFGTGGLPEVALRTHIFARRGGTRAGIAEAQEANRLTIGVLRDQAVTVTGYTQCGQIFYDETILLSDEEVNGVKVHEVVSMFRVYVEEV